MADPESPHHLPADQFCRLLVTVQALKQDGGEWAAKYARGGNTRKQSARRFYIAYDALLGHLATSGMAPMPQAKLDKVLQNVDQAKELLAAGK